MNPETNTFRQIVLDTETTGMNQFSAHYEGHGIIEIGAVELINRRYTGRTYHVYINPQREVDPEAIKVHGITNEMLCDKPVFAQIADEFIEFIQGAELVIHNAPFDVGFMDYEFSKIGKQIKTLDICTVTDSLTLARQMYPGKRNSLDALCDRLGIDNSKRTLHGALLDAEILADAYLAMTGGQTDLFSEEENTEIGQVKQEIAVAQNTINSEQQFLCIQPNENELTEHLEYLKLINKKSHNKCIWVQRLSAYTAH